MNDYEVIALGAWAWGLIWLVFGLMAWRWNRGPALAALLMLLAAWFGRVGASAWKTAGHHIDRLAWANDPHVIAWHIWLSALLTMFVVAELVVKEHGNHP